jgi:hypothetical protein
MQGFVLDPLWLMFLIQSFVCRGADVISVPVAPRFAWIWVLIYLRMISLLLHSVTFPCSCIPLCETQKLSKIAELAFCHITIYGNALHFDAITLCSKALPRSPYGYGICVLLNYCHSYIYKLRAWLLAHSRLIQGSYSLIGRSFNVRFYV